MKKSTRWLVRGLSTALLAATCTIIAISYIGVCEFRRHFIEKPTDITTGPWYTQGVFVSKGALRFVWTKGTHAKLEDEMTFLFYEEPLLHTYYDPGRNGVSTSPGSQSSISTFLGFQTVDETYPTIRAPYQYNSITVPLIALVAVWILLVMQTWWKVWQSCRAERRHKRGMCRKCGYSLYNMSQCPECGATV